MYIRDDIVIDPNLSVPSISNKDIEILNLVFRRPFQIPICVSVAYIPPTSNIPNAIGHLDSIAETVTTWGVDWVIGGDFNINLLSKGDAARKKVILNFASRNSMTQLIETPTRITSTSRSLLDHVYVNSISKVLESGVLSYATADHLTTFVVFKKNLQKKEKVTFTCRSLKNYQRIELLTCLIGMDWNEFDRAENGEDKWQILLTNFLKGIDLVAPKSVMKNMPTIEPWVSPELLRLIRERDMIQNAINNISEHNKSETEKTIAEYNKKRNEVKREVMRAKRNYVKNHINILDSSTKRYWRELSKIAPIGKKTIIGTANKIILKKGDRTTIEGAEVCEYINDIFISIGPNLSSMIKTNNEDYVRKISIEPEITLETWGTTTDNEVLLLILGLDVHKNSNIDGISSYLLKECMICVAEKVADLFRHILASGVYPDSWKLGSVVPIFKSGCESEVGNYRPVSLLPVIGKLLEKLLHRRLLIFLDSNDYFTESQGGFRPSLSTTDTISKLLSFVYEELNSSSSVVTIFYDLKKAFDPIDHSILLSKLKGAGVKGLCFKLLENYLTNRKQRCKVNNSVSSYKSVTCGVPQGSTLGPLLFIIYVNDVMEWVSGVKILLYADDTVFYNGGTSPDILSATLTESAGQFQHWCQLNRLTLNLDKCKTMLFTNLSKRRRKEFIDKISIKVDNAPLPLVSEYKYLGVVLDDALRFVKHMNMLKKSISHRMFIY